MTDEQLGHARRLVACEQFRWIPGMLAHIKLSGWAHAYAPMRVVQVEAGWLYGRGGECRERPDRCDLNLSDYATAAILLRVALEEGEEVGLYDASTERAGWVFGVTIRAEGAYMNPLRHPDLGTAAALVLLAVWEPTGPSQ